MGCEIATNIKNLLYRVVTLTSFEVKTEIQKIIFYNIKHLQIEIEWNK